MEHFIWWYIFLAILKNIDIVAYRPTNTDYLTNLPYCKICRSIVMVAFTYNKLFSHETLKTKLNQGGKLWTETEISESSIRA